MTFDVFVARVAAFLKVEFPQPANPYDNLYEDLGLDSVMAFELLIVIEAMADCLVQPMDPPVMYTLADAYDYYRLLRSEEYAAAQELES